MILQLISGCEQWITSDSPGNKSFVWLKYLIQTEISQELNDQVFTVKSKICWAKTYILKNVPLCTTPVGFKTKNFKTKVEHQHFRNYSCFREAQKLDNVAKWGLSPDYSRTLWADDTSGADAMIQLTFIMLPLTSLTIWCPKRCWGN